LGYPPRLFVAHTRCATPSSASLTLNKHTIQNIGTISSPQSTQLLLILVCHVLFCIADPVNSVAHHGGPSPSLSESQRKPIPFNRHLIVDVPVMALGQSLVRGWVRSWISENLSKFQSMLEHPCSALLCRQATAISLFGGKVSGSDNVDSLQIKQDSSILPESCQGGVVSWVL
jgi:hypothetical protein